MRLTGGNSGEVLEAAGTALQALCRKARLEIPGFVEKLLPQVVELVRFSKLLPQGEEHAIRRRMREAGPEAESTVPLPGVRVLDMTRVLAGPSCTQVLGDLGAEVTKVERPQVGDDTRGFAPPFLPGAAQETKAMAAYFAAQNRNKASLTVNYTLPEGQDILRRLLKTSDVLVENFKTGTLEKYGLGYDDLRHSFPSLVYCSITGFGQTGPYSPRPGYDALVQAMGGFMSVTGEVEGEPMKVGVPIHDLFAGLHGVIGILAALRHAAMTGEGQHVDIGMLDVSTAMLANQASNFLSTGKVPDRLGNQHPNIVPYQVMPASDGYFILAVGNDPTFQRFVAVADKADPAAKAPALLDDGRFNSQSARVENRKLVTDTCNAITRKKPVEWWLRELESASIGCSPIKNLQEVFEDPQVKAREMVIDMPIEGHAPAKLVASPLKFSSTPCSYRRPPPGLGEHTESLLADAGFSTKEIAQLREKGRGPGQDLKNFNLLVDSIDDVLEKVDTNLRDAKSGKQAEEASGGDEEEPAPTPSAGSHAVRAAKPQVRWRQLVDNHRKRFVPRLLVKHNEKTPLSLMLLEAQCKAGIRSSSGVQAPQTHQGGDDEDPLPNPYEEELSALSWPDEFFRPQACRFNRMEDTPLIMVRTEEELKEMVEEIKGTCIGQEIAVDVEHHDFRSFRGFVCLIQVSTRKKDFLIDPFDIFEQLHMLNEVFSDPRIVKVLHGADRDVLWLQRDFSIYLVNMFDTGLATRALRLQGGYSLANLVSHFCGVRKDMDDWSTDPVAAPVQTELHAIESGRGSGGLGHHVSAPLESPGKAQGPGDCNGAEVQRLREENAMLRAQVRELQVVLATGVLTEIARLREENEELQLKSAVVAESWIGKGWKGPAALLQAPYDLFLVFSIKAAEITAYYGFSYIFVSYVSDEYGMSDEEAGRLYGAYGFACTGVGLLLGFLIDRLGVRRSMLLGCTCSTLYRAICALASSRQLMWFSTMTFAPVGAAFGVPVLALAVRRYTHRENRAFAFSFFYSMLCLGCLLGSVLINIVRDVLVDGTVVLGVKLSWMRMVLWMCTACTFYTVIASLFVRDIQILSDMPLKDREYCKFKPANFQVRQTIKEIMGQAKFWRLAGITGIFIGVRMTFRHLDATFPKYFIRTYGPQAPFEIILGINPIVEMIGTPLMTGLLLKWNTTLSQKLLWGSFISGISVFALAIWESYLGAVVFVLVLSLGDTIWSPTLYEFSTMAATEGKEGMFLAITMAPMYLAALPVGLISGWALGNFCPQNVNPEERRSQLMWFIIGITGFVSPVALWFFQKKLILPEDENAGEKELERDEGEGEYRQTRRLRDAGDAVGQSPASTLQEGTTLVIGRPLPDEVVPEVKLDKKYQTADWRERPLSTEMVHYARADTHYLLFCYDCLKNALLAQSGMASKSGVNVGMAALESGEVEATEEGVQNLQAVLQKSAALCSQVYKEVPLDAGEHASSLSDRFGSRQRPLNPTQMGVLKALIDWRDQLARSIDESLNFVAPDACLWRVCLAMPTSPVKLRSTCNPLPSTLQQHAQEVVDIIIKSQHLGVGPVVKLPASASWPQEERRSARPNRRPLRPGSPCRAQWSQRTLQPPRCQIEWCWKPG
ncbi:unnamed protein product, partial [Symbiodinium necroappetens]